MLTHEEINDLLTNVSIRSYKSAVSKEPMKLSTHQQEALGTSKRNLLRVVKTVINAIADKLFIERIESNIQTNIDTWYSQNRIDVLQRDLYKLVIRDGLAYVQVKFENNTPVTTIIEAYDGRVGAISFYNTRTKKEEFVINTWYAGTTRNIDVYYADRIEKYMFNEDNEWKPRKDTPNEQWPIDWTDDTNQPLGIALVRFDIGESDIVEAVQIQRDMNEAILDLLSTSRTMGWPQRVLKNASQETYLLNQYSQPLLDFGTTYPIPRKIELTPGSILMLQGNESSLEQLDSAKADTTVLDMLRSLLSDVTTVPHYFFTGSDFPSGVALLNAEMRLNHKVESHQGHLTPAFVSMFLLMARVNNTFGTTSLDTSVQIDIIWASPEIYTEDLKMDMQTARADFVMKARTMQAMSVETAVRILHPNWDETAIQREVAAIKAEQSIEGI